MLTNTGNRVLYIGVTNNLERRVFEHQAKQPNSFTGKYNCNKLVFYEECSNINDAIAREKQLKGWSRKKKERLLEQMNPTWKDLFENY
jgi:putative endonuclease